MNWKRKVIKLGSNHRISPNVKIKDIIHNGVHNHVMTKMVMMWL